MACSERAPQQQMDSWLKGRPQPNSQEMYLLG
jgi:hypothetical protein